MPWRGGVSLFGLDVSVQHPIDHLTLADYWAGLLDAAQSEAVDLHLLECDACGDRLREMISLAEAMRDLAASGSLRMVVSDAFVQSARERGMQVRQYDQVPGGSVQCTVSAEDDLLIGRMAADLRDASRVDLAFCDGSGAEQFRAADVPFDREAQAVVLQESITFAKDLPTTTMIARLLAVDSAGSERLVGEYTFNHTRTLPGPGKIRIA